MHVKIATPHGTVELPADSHEQICQIGTVLAHSGIWETPILEGPPGSPRTQSRRTGDVVTPHFYLTEDELIPFAPWETP